MSLGGVSTLLSSSGVTLSHEDSECVGFTSSKLRLDLIFVLHMHQERRIEEAVWLSSPSFSFSSSHCLFPLSCSPLFPQCGEKGREGVWREKGKKKKKKNVIFFAGPCQLSLILYSPSHGRNTEVESQGLRGKTKKRAFHHCIQAVGESVEGRSWRWGIQTFSCSTELKTCPAGLF